MEENPEATQSQKVLKTQCMMENWWGWNYSVQSKEALSIEAPEDTKVRDKKQFLLKKEVYPFFTYNGKDSNIVLTLEEGKSGWDKAATSKP